MAELAETPRAVLVDEAAKVQLKLRHSKEYGTAPAPSPEDEEEKALVEKIIDEIGLGRFHIRVFFICGLFFFADIMEVMFLTYLKMAWSDNKDVSQWWSAAIGTSVFCGMLFGASLWGWVSDRYGRKTGLYIVAIFISVFGLASSFAPNVQVLVLCRAMVGFGLGGSHISVTLLMELVPPRQRNNMLNLFQGFTVLGVWAEAGLAWAFMEDLGWQKMALFTSVPSFLAVAILFWLPESPLWLVVARKPAKAAQVLQRMANTNKRKVYIDEEKLAGMADIKVEGHQGNYKQLFAPSLWKSTLLIWVVWFSNSMVYYGLMLLTPDYLASAKTDNVYRDMFVSTIAELPALLLASLLIRTVGAPTSQAIFFLGSVALTLVVGTVKAVETQIAAIFVSWLIRLFTSGGFYNTYTLTPAIYPTNIRSIGFGAGSSMSRIGGMITPFVANLAEVDNMFIPCMVYACTSFLGMFAGFFLNFTTRGFKKAERVPLLPNKKGTY